MARGRRLEAWNHTSSVLWLLYACHCSEGEEKSPADFNPMIERAARPEMTTEEWHMVRDGLLEMKGQRTR